MTYSIVARDPVTGEIGVAVQTRWPFVGSVVPWAEPGVGAVATQAFAESSYGPLGLDRMRAGASAAAALEALLADDPGRDLRQVGMVDAIGGTAAFTGPRCVAEAGHETAADVSVQANLMERATVWPTMASAYRSAEGDLADRLMAALRAAEGEGGDVRGRESAALLIVPAAGPRWATRFDLGVDDHRTPLDELARLLRLARAYEAFDRSIEHSTAGDLAAASASMVEAAAMAPNDDQITLWSALFLASTGRIDEARSAFDSARAVEPRGQEHLRRFLAAGQLPLEVAPLIDALAGADVARR
jgi:uncharacterized Ntn-hydrolase superfamily protein